MGYTVEMERDARPVPDTPSLRSDQVAQTRAALVASARRRFGRDGFAGTSVEEVAAEARVTTGALYHHFRTKTALFEAVFVEVHLDILAAAAQASQAASDELELLMLGSDAFLNAVLEPEVQRIVITDGPAILGLARFTELDELGAAEAIVAALDDATRKGLLLVEDPGTVARLLLGALARGGMLIANAEDPAATRAAVSRSVRALLAGLRPPPATPPGRARGV